MIVTAKLKPFEQIYKEASHVSWSRGGDYVKIWHPDSLNEDGLPKRKSYLLANTGSNKGYIGFFADYKIYFGRTVQITAIRSAKRNCYGALNKHQCMVLGLRSGKPVFNAYHWWFEFEYKNSRVVESNPVIIPEVSRLSWDDLFRV